VFPSVREENWSHLARIRLMKMSSGANGAKADPADKAGFGLEKECCPIEQLLPPDAYQVIGSPGGPSLNPGLAPGRHLLPTPAV
jgi:hypothetical protein